VKAECKKAAGNGVKQSEAYYKICTVKNSPIVTVVMKNVVISFIGRRNCYD